MKNLEKTKDEKKVEKKKENKERKEEKVEKKKVKSGNTKDINIILDLDGTLLHSYAINTPVLERKIMSKKWLSNYRYHKMDNDFLIIERPNLQDFLDWLVKNFKVTIWSAASPDYVDFIRKKIFGKRKLTHVFNSTNCEESQNLYGELKHLGLLWDKYDLKGFGPHNTLIIDDLKYNTSNLQPNNSIHIKKFCAKEETINDDELLNVKNKLKTIKENYRKNINRDKNFTLTVKM